MFNAAVMGYNSSQHWMDLILEQLDNIATKLQSISTSRVDLACADAAV